MSGAARVTPARSRRPSILPGRRPQVRVELSPRLLLRVGTCLVAVLTRTISTGTGLAASLTRFVAVVLARLVAVSGLAVIAALGARLAALGARLAALGA